MGSSVSFSADEITNYSNKFIEGARDGNQDFVKQCIDKYPDVINVVETFDEVSIALIMNFSIFMFCYNICVILVYS